MIKNKSNYRIHIIYLAIALLIANYLFYLDEGYFDFRWMKDARNWFFFVIYVAGMFGGQVLVHYLTALVRPAGTAKIVTAILAGTPLGLVVLILLLSR